VRSGGRAALLGLLLLLFAAPAAALDPDKALNQYGLAVWTADQGLPQNSVAALLQDREGYLWIATQEGLARFDGQTFVVFDKRREPLLTSPSVLCLLEGRDGTLWAGLEAGGLVGRRQGRFFRPQMEGPLAAESVNTLWEDGEGTLWVGTTEGHLYTCRQDRIAPKPAPGLKGTCIYALAGDGEGRLWAGTNEAVARYGEGVWETVLSAGKEPDWFYALLPEKDGLWVGSYRGLHRWEKGAARRWGEESGLPGSTVTALLFEKGSSTLWLGTSRGLARFREGRFEVLDEREGLPNGNVGSLCLDREGGLWVGTKGGLVHLYDADVVTVGRRQGLRSEVVLAVAEDEGGALWVGTEGGGLVRREGGRSEVVGKELGLEGTSVPALHPEGGALLFHVDGRGIFEWRNGKLRRLHPEMEELRHYSISDLRRLRDGRLALAASSGLYLEEAGGKRLRRIKPDDRWPSPIVNALWEAPDGTLWAGGEGGLLLFREDRLVEVRGKADGLPDVRINGLFAGEAGRLWITTSGGLALFENGRFRSLTAREGLPNETLFAALEDRLGHLWLSSNGGIFRAKTEDVVKACRGKLRAVPFQVFGKADGMASGECNGGTQPPGWRSASGRLLFATMKGVAVVDPGRLRPNLVAPPVTLEGAAVNGRPVSCENGLLRIPPGRHRLEIRFSALTFSAPERVLFRFRMEPFDAEWSAPQGSRTAVYTALPPGSYTFRVTACNKDGVWNEAGASLAVVQEPRLYERRSVQGLAALLLILVLASALWVREKRAEERERELQRLVARRTADLNDLNARLERQAAELEEANRRLALLSQQDDLTGLANRRTFDEALENEWRRALRSGQPLALLMADIDHFKAFNDAYGHLEGDLCLSRVAAVLRESVGRAGDLVARYGGEEFAVILPGLDLPAALAVAENLRRRVEVLGIPTAVSDAAPVVTLSLGAASCVPARERSPRDLLARADAALYAAKRKGRNRVEGADGQPPPERLPG